MSITSSEINVNGLNVSFIAKKDSEAQATVVFIHGFPFSKEIWRRQLEALPHALSGIAYDIRGFGESDPGHGFFNIDLFAADLIAFIQQLELKSVVLCGISMGGYIALRAFERSPECFAGLILCDTNASADTNEAKLNRFASIEKIQAEGKDAFAADFVKKLFHKKTVSENLAVVKFIKEIIRNQSVNTICATQLALASRTDTSHVLKQISVPTLIVRGVEDQLMSQDQTRFLVSAIKNAGFAEIAESGHLPNLENPAGFNACINRFLKQLI